MTNASSALLGIITALGLCGLIPVGLLASVEDGGRSDAWVVTLAIGVYCGAHLSAIISTGEQRLFSFIFHLFCYTFFGLAATIQIRSGLLASTTPSVPANIDFATSAVVAFGILAFDLAYWITWTRPQRRKNEQLDYATVNTRGAFMLVVVGTMFAVYTTARTGFPVLFTSREQLQIARSTAFADPAVATIVFSLSYIPLLIASHAFLQGATEARSAAQKNASRKYFAVGFLTAIMPLTIMNPIANARYTAGTVYGSYLGALGGFKNRRRARISLSLLVGGLLFVFPLADAFRFAGQARLDRGGFFEEFKGAGDYDSFWMIANAILYIQSHGSSLGYQALGSLLFWVPRSVWPDKPVDTGILLAYSAGYKFTNLSSPIWAELLVNFGIAGMAIGFLFFGYICARADAAGLISFARGGHSAIVSSVLPIYTIILLRGSLLQATGTFAVMLFCLLLVRGRRRPALPTPSDPFSVARPKNSIRKYRRFN